jgi:predicted ATPase
MNQPKMIFLSSAFFIICCLSLSNIYAQQPPKKTAEQSFEVILQTVVASNNAVEKSAVPQSLSSIIKKLKSDFSFSHYRLTSTFMQRVLNKGSFDFKSVDYDGSQSEPKTTAYTQWRLNNLQNLGDENGIDLIQIQDFRFEQKLPVKNSTNFSNEQISLTTSFGLMKNNPTVVGCITTSNPGELTFLILTVKPTEK